MKVNLFQIAVIVGSILLVLGSRLEVYFFSWIGFSMLLAAIIVGIVGKVKNK